MTTLKEITERMLGQDNLATGEPIFFVQERRRIYGMDPDYSDRPVWITEDECVEITDEEEIASADAYYDEHFKDPPGLTRTACIDVWEYVQPFFSRKGADRYIEANRHNLKDPRVFVASAYRNDEWIAVRGSLLETQ
jgi:hypothetical protein